MLTGAVAATAATIFLMSNNHESSPQGTEQTQKVPQIPPDIGDVTTSTREDTASNMEELSPVEMPPCAQNMEFPTVGYHPEYYDALEDCKGGLTTPEQIAEFERLSSIAYVNYQTAEEADEAFARKLQQELRSDVFKELEKLGFKDEHFKHDELYELAGEIKIINTPESFGGIMYGITISVGVPQMTEDGDMHYRVRMSYFSEDEGHATYEKQTYEGVDKNQILQDLMYDFMGV